jgi:hypothetical protein
VEPPDASADQYDMDLGPSFIDRPAASATAAFALPIALRAAEALPAVESESTAPGLGHHGLLVYAPGRLGEGDPEGPDPGQHPAGVVQLLSGGHPVQLLTNSARSPREEGSGRDDPSVSALFRRAGRDWDSTGHHTAEGIWVPVRRDVCIDGRSY